MLSTFQDNFIEMKFMGIRLDFNIKNVIAKDLSWTTNYNILPTVYRVKH